MQEVIRGLSLESADYLCEARGILDHARNGLLHFGVGDHAYEVEFSAICCFEPQPCQPVLTMSYNDVTLHLFELGMLSQSLNLAPFLVCKQLTNEESSVYRAVSITQLGEDSEADFDEEDDFTPRGCLKLAIDEKWKLVKLGDICGAGEVVLNRMRHSHCDLLGRKTEGWLLCCIHAYISWRPGCTWVLEIGNGFIINERLRKAHKKIRNPSSSLTVIIALIIPPSSP